MPFPIAIAVGGAALQPASMAFFAEACAVLGITKMGADVYNYYFTNNEGLPTFHTTAEAVVQSARADIDVLVSATSKHLYQVVTDTMQQNVRMDEASAGYELNLITMERGVVKLDEAVTMVVASREGHAGERQRAIETQVNTQSSLARQQSVVKAMAASLENLPELLQNNREKQALRIEHARLLFERDGYASRSEMLLDVLKEKSEENTRLQAQVDGLEAKFSGLASRMDAVLAFAQDKQREVGELRSQLNEQAAEKQNTGTRFSLNLFS